MERVEVTEQQFKDAMNAFSTSAFNGLVGLAATLRGKGLLDDKAMKGLHDGLSAPLSMENRADNPAIQMMQEKIDGWFAAMMSVRLDGGARD